MSPLDDASSSSAHTLVQRLRADLGECLYLVLTYEGETSQVRYVSSVAANALDAPAPSDIDATHPTIQMVHKACRTEAGGPELPFGTRRCSVQLYDEWLLVHYQQPPAGVIIGVDAASAANLRGFLNDMTPVMSRVVNASEGA